MNATVMTKEQRLQNIESTIKQEQERLFNFIRKRVPKSEDAEDILQEVFFQFVKTYKSIDSIEKVTSWLFTVARNKITDSFRKKKAIPFSDRMTSKTEDEENTSFLDNLMADLGNGPEDVLLKNLIWEEITNAIGELPQDQREIFVWHELEKKSFKDYAELHGVSINTLLSRKRYAVQFLRKKLAKVYDELQG